MAAAGAFLVGGLTYLTAEVVAARGWRTEPYSYDRMNISDLGIADISPLHAVMNTGFIVEGTLFVLAGAMLSRLFDGRARVWVLGTTAVHGVGGVIVGLAPAAVDGSSLTHALGAGMAIIGGNLVLLTAARYAGALGAPRWYTVGSGVAGVAGLAALGLFLADPGVLGAGSFERISVYTIIGWEITTGAMLLARRLRGERSATSRSPGAPSAPK